MIARVATASGPATTVGSSRSCMVDQAMTTVVSMMTIAIQAHVNGRYRSATKASGTATHENEGANAARTTQPRTRVPHQAWVTA